MTRKLVANHMDPQKGVELQLLARIATLLHLPEGCTPVYVLKAVLGVLSTVVNSAAPGNGKVEKVQSFVESSVVVMLRPVKSTFSLMSRACRAQPLTTASSGSGAENRVARTRVGIWVYCCMFALNTECTRPGARGALAVQASGAKRLQCPVTRWKPSSAASSPASVSRASTHSSRSALLSLLLQSALDFLLAALQLRQETQPAGGTATPTLPYSTALVTPVSARRLTACTGTAQ